MDLGLMLVVRQFFVNEGGRRKEERGARKREDGRHDLPFREERKDLVLALFAEPLLVAHIQLHLCDASANCSFASFLGVKFRTNLAQINRQYLRREHGHKVRRECAVLGLHRAGQLRGVAESATRVRVSLHYFTRMMKGTKGERGRESICRVVRVWERVSRPSEREREKNNVKEKRDAPMEQPPQHAIRPLLRAPPLAPFAVVLVLWHGIFGDLEVHDGEEELFLKYNFSWR